MELICVVVPPSENTLRPDDLSAAAKRGSPCPHAEFGTGIGEMGAKN